MMPYQVGDNRIVVSQQVERAILVDREARGVKVSQAVADVFDRAKFVWSDDLIVVRWNGRSAADDQMREGLYREWMTQFVDDCEQTRARAFRDTQREMSRRY